MNRARFQRMKHSAFFINIGRGMTTRLDDLAAAHPGGEIAGAGLDVFEQEPLPADHPLWTTARRAHHARIPPAMDRTSTSAATTSFSTIAGASWAGSRSSNVVDKSSWF